MKTSSGTRYTWATLWQRLPSSRKPLNKVRSENTRHLERSQAEDVSEVKKFLESSRCQLGIRVSRGFFSVRLLLVDLVQLATRSRLGGLIESPWAFMAASKHFGGTLPRCSICLDPRQCWRRSHWFRFRVKSNSLHDPQKVE